LVVIAVTSATALVVRTGTGPSPDWALVATLTAASVAGGWAGSLIAARIPAVGLQTAFTGLLVAVGLYTAWRAVPAMA
ncbi:MAG: sulfite exporter TauE/SafE family protein, partial [Nocardioidaceae bacterium]